MVGLAEIKKVFKFYLDIHISDADIQEFIDEHDYDSDQVLNFKEFAGA